MNEILTPTGYIPLSSLSVGDEVIAQGGGVNVVEQIDIWTPDTDPDNQGIFTFYKINDTYYYYKNQSIYANGNVCHAFELQVGDILSHADGSTFTVDTIEEIGNQTEWYRLKVSNNHTYIVDDVVLHNASRFWVGAGATTAWAATSNTNWSATSGGANNATVPGSSDDVTFDGAGGGNSASVMTTNFTILSLTFTGGYTNTITLGNAGTQSLTIAGNFTDNTAHTWTNNSTAANPLIISAASTIASGGKTFPFNVSFSGSNTKTLNGSWTITGQLTTAVTVINQTGTDTLHCAGLSPSSNLSGTAKIELTGGTWVGPGTVSNNLDINGNVTISGATVAYGGGTLTYIAGTVTTTGSTISLGFAATTINTNGITFNNVTVLGGTTLTINSLLSLTGTMSIPGTVTFAGTAGWTCGTYSNALTGAGTTTFQAGNTYTITTALNCFNSRTGAIQLFTSSSATVKAIIILQQGATCNCLANFTRIDASAGRTIWTFNGTVTSCLNINSFTSPQTVASTY